MSVIDRNYEKDRLHQRKDKFNFPLMVLKLKNETDHEVFWKNKKRKVQVKAPEKLNLYGDLDISVMIAEN